MLHLYIKRSIALLCQLLLCISIGSCGASLHQSAQPSSVYALIQANSLHPPHRAVALAEDPGGKWAGGQSWGASTEQDAINLALAKCEEGRLQNGTRNPCKLYSVNGETSYGKQQPVVSTTETVRRDAPVTQTQFVLQNTYLSLHRAVALANDPGGLWAGGQSSGASTEQEAIDLALVKCEQERAQTGIRNPCEVYSVNGRIASAKRQPAAPPTRGASTSQPEKTEPPHGASIDQPVQRPTFKYELLIDHAKRPSHRAVALAEDPGGKWAGGQSWGASTEQDAVNVALKRCEKDRLKTGIRNPCELYSLNGRTPYPLQQPAAPPTREASTSQPQKRQLPPPTSEASTPQPQKKQLPPPSPSAKQFRLAGTGFAVTDDGFILTAHHVIEDANAVTVRLADGTALEAKVVKVSHNIDLALLKINSRTPDYLPINASQTGVASGDRVFTFGFPVVAVLGAEPKFSDGAISSMTGPGGEITFLQITVPVQPGNSGGPLVSEQGEVVGIITASVAIVPFLKATGTLPQNVNWAVNAAFAAPLVPKAPSQNQMLVKRKEIIDRARKSVVLIEALKADPS
jgi:S1-C subfamily serine protease